ncbi:hypothetical protein M0R45_026498 [Rubus argutus]|uniref:Uncharacterized protein n=1 Tax=Rubus argutus TaxID=59490 RepID=A0AAW1X079_RUBAR
MAEKSDEGCDIAGGADLNLKVKMRRGEIEVQRWTGQSKADRDSSSGTGKRRGLVKLKATTMADWAERRLGSGADGVCSKAREVHGLGTGWLMRQLRSTTAVVVGDRSGIEQRMVHEQQQWVGCLGDLNLQV